MNSLVVVGVDFDGDKHKYLSGGEVDKSIIEAAGADAVGCFSIVFSGIRLPGHKMALNRDGDQYFGSSGPVDVPGYVRERLGPQKSLYLSFKPCSRESLR